jgi:hypothetical protein
MRALIVILAFGILFLVGPLPSQAIPHGPQNFVNDLQQLGPPAFVSELPKGPPDFVNNLPQNGRPFALTDHPQGPPTFANTTTPSNSVPVPSTLLLLGAGLLALPWLRSKMQR